MTRTQAEERGQAILSEIGPEVAQAVVVMARVGYDEREGK
jgi:hypothetical protein